MRDLNLTWLVGPKRDEWLRQNERRAIRTALLVLLVVLGAAVGLKLGLLLIQL